MRLISSMYKASRLQARYHSCLGIARSAPITRSLSRSISSWLTLLWPRSSKRRCRPPGQTLLTISNSIIKARRSSDLDARAPDSCILHDRNHNISQTRNIGAIGVTSRRRRAWEVSRVWSAFIQSQSLPTGTTPSIKRDLNSPIKAISIPWWHTSQRKVR